MLRRELLTSALGLAAVGLAPACGNRNARVVRARFDEASPELGHRLRDSLPSLIRAARDAPVVRTDVVIVGAGVAGLAAARALRLGGVEDVRVLELHETNGGTSSGGRSAVTPFPWGAHYLPVPRADDVPLAALLDEMGLVEGVDPRGVLRIREPYLVRSPEERIFENGRFHEGERPLDGASRASRDAFARFDALVARYIAARDAHGARAFDNPVERSGRAEDVLALDAMTATRFLGTYGLSDARLLAYLDYGVRDDFGCSLDTVSAWALMHYHVSRCADAHGEPAPQIAFPDGNHTFVRHLAAPLGGRVRTSAMVVDVRDVGDAVEVLGYDVARDAPLRIRARRAIVATPKYVAARIVASVREDASRPFAPFTYAPWMVANVHLDTRPRSRGLPFAWDTVLSESRSLGYVTATHQRGRDTGPTVLTYYLAFADADPNRARRALLESDPDSLCALVLDDLRAAHQDIDECVTEVVVRRHGHAMVRPVPNFYTSDARRGARVPRGLVHFGNTDDSGMALFEEAFAQGMRAGAEVVRALAGA